MSEHHKKPDRAPTSAAGGARGYKRSWKNLLLNKRYQLVFTLMMVGVSSILMVGLGWWVMRVVNQTTVVGINLIRPCGEAPSLAAVLNENAALSAAAATPTATDAAAGSAATPPTMPAVTTDAAGSAAPDTAAAGSAATDAAAGSATAPADAVADADADDEEDEDRPRRSRVVMGETSMEVTAIAPPDFVEKVVAHASCEMESAGTKSSLERGRKNIFLALLIAGLALVVGLAVYGIKMTHKVAGPLFKVSLYLAKMKEGRLDKVWNLRKGDQLMEFYEHFKQGHAGLVAMQKSDLETLRDVVARAEAEGWSERSEAAAAAVSELRAMIAQKEKSLE
jgi:ABC-type multidrug transport system fused ATPase/permease subunit